MPTSPFVLTRLARGYASLRHAAASTAVRLAYFTVTAVITMWPVLEKANLLNIYQDSQHFTLFEEAARLSVTKFHELPLWDPYFCGGIAGLGTPSARFAAPTFLLTLLFGTLRGAALTSVVMTVVGLEGVYRYARSRGAGALGSMTAAPVFALSGVFNHATLLAWTNFFGFELVPWALIGVRLAMRGSRRGLVLTALTMGFMVGFGGTYTAPLTLLAAAFEVACLLIVAARRPGQLPRMTRAAVMGVVVVLLSASVSMVRLWPVAENLAASPRLLGGTPGTAPEWVWKHLFGEASSFFTKGDFFIGLPVLPVLIFGLWRKRSVAPAIGLALWVWFAVGYKTHASLFALLRTIPPYTMLRAPERFLAFVALAAVVLAALGIRKLEAAGRKRVAYLALAVGFQALLVFDTGLLVHLSWVRSDARKMDPEPPRLTRDFRQTRGNRWLAAYYPFISRGSLTCFDDYDVVQSPGLRGDLPAEEYLRDGGAGTVRRVAWSPNRITLHVSLTRPARVYVNQNWHPGWHSDVGAVVSEDGLLGVDLAPGTYDVTLHFWPRSGVAGMVTTLFGLVAAIVIAGRGRRETRETIETGREWAVTAALAGAPLVVVAASFYVMNEPRRPPPPLLTQSGEPMAVEARPDDTTPLGSGFESGIVLEAAHVELEPAEEGRPPLATVELDWRFNEAVPPGLGVFLQFERPGNHFATDHVLLSGVVVPEAAPLHTIVRDISEPVTVPQGKNEETWKVYAGVWRARRDMSRLKITTPGAGTVSADRVLVGTITVASQASSP